MSDSDLSDDPLTFAVPEFIRKLYSILDESSTDNMIKWGVEGTSFIIKDPNEFAKTILASYFKHCNISSFVRQLNKYGFHKVKSSNDSSSSSAATSSATTAAIQSWEFQHPNFQKNRLELLSKIKRKIPGSNRRLARSNEGETRQLQDQLESLSDLQKDLAKYVGILTRNYKCIIEEMFRFRSIIASQNELMRNISAFLDNGGGNYNNFVASNEPYDLFSNFKDLIDSSDLGDSIYNSDILNSKASVNSTQGARKEPPTVPVHNDTCNFPEISEIVTKTTLSFGGRQSKPSSSLSSSLSNNKSQMVPKWNTPPKVLLVEDDAVCRSIGMKLLQVFGCSFDVASDGMDAIKKMNLQRYDIVLMDIVMPNLDGVSATCQIRQFDQQTPIISMTSNFQRDDCMTYLANGMNDILPKPVSRDSLLAMLDRYCSHLKERVRMSEKMPLLGFSNSLNSAFCEYTVEDEENVRKKARQ